jgi:hypothetical protein
VPLVDVRRTASRPSLRPWWQWRHLDLGLGVLGLLLLLRTPVLGEGTAGLDPSTLALPGIGLVLLALVSLRLLPLIAWLAGRVERGLALSLASWQLGRRPLQHSLLALLLLVTVALGVFAGTYVTTQRRNADDRAAYQAGADVRARFSDDVNVPPIAKTLSGLRGVEDATPVYRGSGQFGRLASAAPTVLGVDPVAFDRVAWSRPGLDDPSLRSSLGKLVDPGDDAVRLPGRPTRIGAWVEGGGADASLTAVVVDVTGRSDTVTLGHVDHSGWRYFDAPIAAGLHAPLFLRELDVRAASTGAGHTATAALRDLSVTLPGSPTPHVVAGFASTDGTGWWATQPGTGLSRGQLKATTNVLFQGRPSTVLPVDPTGGDTVIRPVPRGAVPALASAATLEHTQVPTGVPFPLTIGAAQVPVVVVGRVDYVPTLYPGQEDFLVLELHGLLAHLGYGGEPHAWPNELWANVAPTSDAADRAALQRSPSIAQVLDRRDAQRAAASDPLTAQLEANLSIGFATALVLAIAAFGLHFLAAAAGRRGEYAILEANGLAPRTIRRSLVAEQLTVLAFGVLVGLGLGLLTAWIVLPALHLETGPAATIPPTVVTVQWGLLAGALAVIAALAAGAGLAAGRAARRFSLVEELRTL